MRPLDLARWVLAHLRRSPGRALLAMFGVALGAALLVSLLSIVQGIQDEAEASAVWLATPGRLIVTGQRLQDADVARLARLAGAADALPILATPFALRHDEHTLPAGVAALGPSMHRSVPYRLLAGSALDPHSDDGLVLSRAAAEALGFPDPRAAVGQSLELTTNAASPGPMRVLVAGVAEDLADQNAVVSLSLAEHLLAEPNLGPGGLQAALSNRLAANLLVGARAASLDPLTYVAILVVPQSTADVPQLAGAVRAAGYALPHAGQVPPALQRTFNMVRAGLASLGLLASLGSALGVAHVLASRTAERTAEIGVLKALGATDQQVAQLVGAEALVLGICGGLLGVLLGWSGAHAASAIAQLVLGPLPEPHAAPEVLLATPIITTLLALLAAAVPAVRAWRLRPVEAFRHQ